MTDSLRNEADTEATKLAEKAREAFANGDMANASALAKQAVESDDQQHTAWDLLAQIALNQNILDKAIEFSKKAILEAPKIADYYLTLGNAHKVNREFEKAKENYLIALEYNDQLAPALQGLGMLELDTGNLNEGYNYLKRYLNFEPNDPFVLNNLGCIAAMTQQWPEAKEHFEKAHKIKKDYADPLNNLGNLHLNLGEYDKAFDDFQKALVIAPNHENAYNNIGNVYKAKHELEKAKESFEKVLSINPNHPEALNNLGIIFIEAEQYEKALEMIQQALQHAPIFPEAKLNLGICYMHLEAFDKAKSTLEESIQLAPNRWEGYYNLALVNQFMGQYDVAFQLLHQVIELNPNHIASLYYLAKSYHLGGRYEDALKFYQKLIELDPMNTQALSSVAYIHAKLCKVHETEKLKEALISKLEQNWQQGARNEIDTFEAAALNFDDTLLNKICKEQAQNIEGSFKPHYDFTNRKHDRIRIGYISPDFNQHPIGIQIREMFKWHNRSKFEIYCYSLVEAQPNPYTPLIKNSCDHFITVSHDGPNTLSEKIYKDEIDILVDLAGYTGNSMPQTFALQPAPIQCHWMGSSHSLQASFIQYFIGHKELIPESLRDKFSENIAYLPNAPFATQPFTDPLPAADKKEYGLPEDKFIFCCFVQSYRMNLKTLNAWMRILKNTKDTVLWLRADSEEIEQAVREFATSQGVEADRLYFMPIAHLTEKYPQQLADLWIDPLEMTSGTGTFLSLWGECPLLTVSGQTTQTKYASALLHACQLDALVASDEEDYIQKAIDYANHPEKVKALKKELAENKANLPIFNVAALMKDLEKVYLAMWQEWSSHQSFKDITVE